MTGDDLAAGHPIRLDEWLSRHGPLWPAAALAMTLDACAAASRMDHRTLRAVTESLNAAGVSRLSGGWTWAPTPVPNAIHDVSDHQIVERLGALLFVALSGEAQVDLLATEHVWRATLRTSRPGLPPAVVDLTIGALAARRRRGVTLAGFAREIRKALGVERRAERRQPLMRLRTAAAVAVVVLAAASWTLAVSGGRVGTQGLTAQEAGRQDIIYEFATTDALIDEHTASLGLFQLWEQTWQARLAPDDPRFIWSFMHQAWVRTLAGDRLTAQQFLEAAPDRLSRSLGPHHPYTRAARLQLADTLAARGATARAATLKAEADRGWQELSRTAGLDAELLTGVPAPPGVIAHVSPNLPEREGFRAREDGGYLAPLTSLQRLIAGRDGWRLHVVAEGPCRVSVAVGNVPRRITVEATKGVGGRWQVLVLGTLPMMTADAGPEKAAQVSLAADGGGHMLAHVGTETRSADIDTRGNPPDPPYALTFAGLPSTTSAAGRGDDGCALVWLEIPFPYYPGAKVTEPPLLP